LLFILNNFIFIVDSCISVVVLSFSFLSVGGGSQAR